MPKSFAEFNCLTSGQPSKCEYDVGGEEPDVECKGGGGVLLPFALQAVETFQ